MLKKGKIKTLPLYEDVIRPFKVDSSQQFTDVWDFPSVRPFKGKHPAEKPIELLEQAIRATTYPGDIILDCFAGSGSTGSAAIKSGRLVVLMDIDPTWISRIAKRIELDDNIRALKAQINDTLWNLIELKKKTYPKKLPPFFEATPTRSRG